MDSLIGYWVEHDELTGLRNLGWSDAGNSILWECWLRGQRYVFKEYADEFCADADRDALGRLIAWRDGLSDVEREYVDRIAAWPRYRVRQAGLLQGVLLPFAPEEFFHRRLSDRKRLPHILASLIRLRVQGQVVPGAPAKVKKHALGHAAEVLLWLHDRGVRVNDLRETNILCRTDGRAVYYVDCDVMMGPWGAVGRAAAPDYLAVVLPATLRPTRPDERPTCETELARLAWMATWVLLDDFSLRTVPGGRLAAVIEAEDADLLTRSSRGQGDTESWRQLAYRWTTRWTATATVPRARYEPQITPTIPVDFQTEPVLQPPTQASVLVPPAPTRPMVVVRRRNRSHEWMPERYRKDPVPDTPPALVASLTADSVRSNRNLMLVGLAAVLLLAVVGALLTLANGH